MGEPITLVALGVTVERRERISDPAELERWVLQLLEQRRTSGAAGFTQREIRQAAQAAGAADPRNPADDWMVERAVRRLADRGAIWCTSRRYWEIAQRAEAAH